MKNISIRGARTHNLQNIDVDIPRDKLTVITGLSGSGKSSLAFDTIFAEGQRRYIETFSVYARQFLGNLERPDVDKIEGLSPVVSIEQKTISKNPRSTVGTVTEIYDFIRLLFARVSTAFSFHSGKPMIKYSDSEIQKLILKTYHKQKILILAPVVRGRKGHYRELFEQILKKGFSKVRIDGEIVQISEGLKLDRYKIHDIEIIIDRLEVNSTIEKRLSDAQPSLAEGLNIVEWKELSINDIGYEALRGKWLNTNPTNAYHYCEIIEENGSWYWTNAANVMWPIYEQDGLLLVDTLGVYGIQDLMLRGDQDGNLEYVYFNGGEHIKSDWTYQNTNDLDLPVQAPQQNPQNHVEGQSSWKIFHHNHLMHDSSHQAD